MWWFGLLVAPAHGQSLVTRTSGGCAWLGGDVGPVVQQEIIGRVGIPVTRKVRPEWETLIGFRRQPLAEAPTEFGLTTWYLGMAGGVRVAVPWLRPFPRRMTSLAVRGRLNFAGGAFSTPLEGSAFAGVGGDLALESQGRRWETVGLVLQTGYFLNGGLTPGESLSDEFDWSKAERGVVLTLGLEFAVRLGSYAGVEWVNRARRPALVDRQRIAVASVVNGLTVELTDCVRGEAGVDCHLTLILAEGRADVRVGVVGEGCLAAIKDDEGRQIMPGPSGFVGREPSLACAEQRVFAGYPIVFQLFLPGVAENARWLTLELPVRVKPDRVAWYDRLWIRRVPITDDGSSAARTQ